MDQYRIRIIETGEFVRLNSGKTSWTTIGAAKSAYSKSGTYVNRRFVSGKFNEQSLLEVVKFVMVEEVEFDLMKANLVLLAHVLGEALQKMEDFDITGNLNDDMRQLIKDFGEK